MAVKVSGVGGNQQLLQMLQLINQTQSRREAKIDKKIYDEQNSLAKLIELADTSEQLNNINSRIGEFNDFALESGKDLEGQVTQGLYEDKVTLLNAGQQGYDYLSNLYKDNPANPSHTPLSDDEVRTKFLELTSEDYEKSGIKDVTLSSDDDLKTAKDYLQNKKINEYADSIFYDMDWGDIMREMAETNNAVMSLQNAVKAGVELKGADKFSVGALLTVQQQREAALLNKLYVLQEMKGFKLHGDESSLTQMRDRFSASMLTLDPKQFAGHYEEDKANLASKIRQKIQLALGYSEKGMNTATYASNDVADGLDLDEEVIGQIYDMNDILHRTQYFESAQDFSKEATDLNYLYKELFGEYYTTDEEYLKTKDGKYFNVAAEYDLTSDEELINQLSNTESQDVGEVIEKAKKDKKLSFKTSEGEIDKQKVWKTLHNARENDNFVKKIEVISEEANISIDDVKKIFKEEESKYILTDEAQFSGKYMSKGYNPETGKYQLEWVPSSHSGRAEFSEKMQKKKIQQRDTEILNQANEMQNDAPVYVNNIGKKLGQENYEDTVKILTDNKDLDITETKQISKAIGFFISDESYQTGGYDSLKLDEGIGSLGLGIDGKSKDYNAKKLIKTWNSNHGQENIESFIKYYGNDDVISKLSDKEWIDLNKHIESVVNVMSSITSKGGVINKLKGGTKFAVDLIRIAEKYGNKMYGEGTKAEDDKSIYLSSVKLKLKKALGIDSRNKDANWQYRNKTIDEFLRWSRTFDKKNKNLNF